MYSKRLDGQYKDLFGVKQPQRKNYKPQLVHDFSHQQYHGQIIVKSPETATNLTGHWSRLCNQLKTLECFFRANLSKLPWFFRIHVCPKEEMFTETIRWPGDMILMPTIVFKEGQLGFLRIDDSIKLSSPNTGINAVIFGWSQIGPRSLPPSPACQDAWHSTWEVGRVGAGRG